jgi:hypothetical protein
MRKRITYKHYKTGEKLTAIGTIPAAINNGSSDRLVLKTSEGEFIDIIKSTILAMEDVI